jgi:hypothetical protein
MGFLNSRLQKIDVNLIELQTRELAGLFPVQGITTRQWKTRSLHNLLFLGLLIHLLPSCVLICEGDHNCSEFLY